MISAGYARERTVAALIVRAGVAAAADLAAAPAQGRAGASCA
jgi:hypothetical protein